MILRDFHHRSAIWAVAFTMGLGGALSLQVPPAAAQANPCPYTNDGDCDEPEGLGYCAEGTDVVDCSNPSSNFGDGSGYAGDRLPGAEEGETAFYARPLLNQVPLDACYNFAGNCGQAAADAFCRIAGVGYAGALSFEYERAPHTWVIGDDVGCWPVNNNMNDCTAIVNLTCGAPVAEPPDDPNDAGCRPDPGTLQNMEVGRRYCFEVTGRTSVVMAVLYGGADGAYTQNSNLSMAAVHAGVLANGQTGRVFVEIEPGQGLYHGSTSHGVTSGSSDWRAYTHYGFRFVTSPES